MANVSTVAVIDTSYSMTDSNYVNITKRASKAYVSYPIPGDRLGVVNYDTNAHKTFSDNGSLATVNQGLDQNKEAANTIERLTFTGDHTNIGDGIQTARSMLDSASNPRGMVLLTDGYQNYGTDPLSVLPSDYPIYACAMGQAADTNLMKEIASRTNGKYYNAPYPSTMMQIYNDIHGQSQFVNTVANDFNSISPQDYRLMPSMISNNNLRIQFGIVWDNEGFAYTNSPNPAQNQISVTVMDSAGNLLTEKPTIVGSGYVVYQFDRPASGKWYTQLIYGGNGAPFTVTSGVFEYPDNPASSIRLNANFASSNNFTGENSLEYTLQVTQNDEPLTDVEIQAHVTSPSISVDNAINKYSSELVDVVPDESDLKRGVPEKVARLSALRRIKMKQGDILASKRSVILKHHPGDDGLFTGIIDDATESGSHAVKLVIKGRSPITGEEFQRTELISTVV